MLNITSKTLPEVSLNNDIKFTNFGSLDTEDISLLNGYLKGVNIPNITTKKEEISIQQIKKYIPLYRKEFEQLTMTFFYHPKIIQYFIQWFQSQFDENGVPIHDEKIYRDITLQKEIHSKKINYNFKYTFVTNLQIFDTLTVNSHDLLEIQVTLNYTYLDITEEEIKT